MYLFFINLEGSSIFRIMYIIKNKVDDLRKFLLKSKQYFLIWIYLAYKKIIYQCSVGSSETSWECNLRVKTM